MSKENSKIVRRPDRVEGGVTPEELERMNVHADMWIGRAYRTDPIDPNKIIPAIKGLYAAADLKEPRVLIVPSPLVMAVAGGLASYIWGLRKTGDEKSTQKIIEEATQKALQFTQAVLEAPLVAMMGEAADRSTHQNAREATATAFNYATAQATRRATELALTDDFTFNRRLVPYGAIYDAVAPMLTIEEAKKAILESDAKDMIIAMILSLGDWTSMYQGGNMWAAWDCYLTAARDILGLRLPCHAKYAWWEQCAIHGGFRFLHTEFCMVSDFPEFIITDDQHRPHCETGPTHRWRDGWSIYHLHGVRVPDWLVETKASDLDPVRLTTIDNAEVRREFVCKVGAERIVSTLSPGPIDSRTYTTSDGRTHPYELHRLKVADGEEWTYLKFINPSVGLTHFEGVPNECLTVQQALNFRNGFAEPQISEDGAWWMQQGDVVLLPEGATKFRPFPSVLT